jgi:23S rRNA pseudouridine955/2504/2580 synthase
MKEFTVESKISLKEFTDNNYPQGSFFWNYLLKNREIKVNGKKVGTDQPLCVGDRVAYYLPPEKETKSAYSIVYEDELLLVVDKESGVNSEAVYADLCRSDRKETYFIHRLDRNTSGLLAFAKTQEAERELKTAFHDRRVEKIYHALCFGSPKRETEVLTAYLEKNAEQSTVKIYDTPKPNAEKIVTEYRVLAREKGRTVFEVKLHTGKTHQIRAHLAHIGCPIVGDNKYGNTLENAKAKVARQRLVAKRLVFSFDGGSLQYLSGREFLSRFDVKEDGV